MTYSAIDPSKAELSQAGKTVVITGAGSGIGRATALSFAVAGASTLVLIGRTESTLEDTKMLIAEEYPKCTASVFPVSVTDEAGMHDIAKQVGKWDVLVLGAAHISSPAAIVKTSLQDWWTAYETNVKSVVIASQAFIPNAKPGACLYSLTAGAALLPPAYTPGLSGYLTSKLTQSKIVEFLAAENPDLFACSVHPGMVDTGIFRGSGADPTQLPMDTRKFFLDTVGSLC
jgi:NAD(P)-dependent dehydrogenase (short-subunit alcohol dehydrogenase family)